jgi:DNA topoisomerase-1
MDVVVVESPAKAQTINKYLGKEFTVLASYGHVRDLLEKDGAVKPDDGFAMVWELRDRGKQRIGEIARSVKGAKRLILATDPDREGEAISWHVKEVLEAQGALKKGVSVERVTFNAITRDAVLDAMKHPRAIDRSLVEAYLARRALDYLVGFTLSPVLWRKLPGSRSAGRVQSVALRLICEREDEIERFKAEEYWSVDVRFRTPKGESFTARLTHLDGQRLDKLALGSEGAAAAAVRAIEAGDFAVAEIERKETRRNPSPPFTTSTLQQEASRKLGFGASRTMRIAQQLYEGVDIGGDTVGLITYMRTDSVILAPEAIQQCRTEIGRRFGADYVPEQPRVYKTRAKNAQEAHEAIRPTDLARAPEDVAGALDADQRRLYELIWKRTLASEMASAVLDQVAVDIADRTRTVRLRANGSVVKFDGFLRVYREDRDEQPEAAAEAEGDDNRLLPPMNVADPLAREAVAPEQHFTQPPPRYSEASLVKKLEELGIGRPSTYATIIQVLQDRNYVRLDKRRFIPEDRGRVVTTFLTEYFRRYVEYGFTAELENQLDEISGGRADWRAVLAAFWGPFSESAKGAQKLSGTEVIDALDAALGPHFFPPRADNADPRRCPSCGTGRLGLKVGKFGGFIGCSNYPECRYTRQLGLVNGDGGPPVVVDRLIGTDPATQLPIFAKVGPYGPYLQLGETAAKGEKPKRQTIPKGFDPDTLDLDTAAKLLALPRTVGPHPDGQPITAAIGRFGPYVKHGTTYRNLPTPADVLTIGLNHAVHLIDTKPERGGRARAERTPERELGLHPTEGEKIMAGAGRYGPYVRLGKTYATLRQGLTVEAVTLDDAIGLIDARLARTGGPRKGGGKAATKPKAAAVAPAAPAEPAPARPAATRPKTAAASAKPGPDKSRPAKPATAKKKPKAPRS